MFQSFLLDLISEKKKLCWVNHSILQIASNPTLKNFILFIEASKEEILS